MSSNGCAPEPTSACSITKKSTSTACASGNHAVDRFDAVRRRRKAGGRDAGSPRNFSRIRVDETPGALFAPEDAAALFNVDAAWLASKLAEPHPVPNVVINHHA